MQRFMLLDHHRLMIRPLLTKCDFHICNHHNRYHYHLYQSIHSKHHHNNHVLETKNNLFIAKSSFFTHSKWRFASKIENDLSKLNSPKTTSPLTEDIRITPKIKKERKLEQHPTVGRNFITTTRAMREYALDITDLVDLRKFQRRSPYNNEPPITVYLRKDVEAKALSIWKNWDRLNAELQKRKSKEDNYSDSLLIVKKYNKDYRRLNTPQAKMREEILRKSGSVVMAAVLINGANCILKFFAWLYTGSHSLFAESVHSLADTCNQLILAYGIRKSIQVPNKEHPYGYHPMRYITSLISGVGIFCTGTGLSVYHGVHGLLNASPVESYYWAFIILFGSFISEGGTLIIAINAARKAAASQGVPLRKYILRGNDPTLNVVILEDAAAVLGVMIAATCMGLTSWYNTPIFDACGSLMIGGLLGVVATFVIVTNSNALIGKSIPPERMAQINKFLESDSMVRAIHDVKATNMGNEVIRYKAEVDFDGRKLSRNYLDSIDLEALFNEFKSVQTIEECEEFILRHGENIVDLLGAEVDRIENELKQKHPQVRHVDLEVL
ncbi:hypothetical protein BLOT_010321 [Blomia tropicalis]|nr:hypothetical protein BLOT_010321 [Blomia tropicalis]